jgi:drug/metabolite transporter (DMT)-like permease
MQGSRKRVELTRGRGTQPDVALEHPNGRLIGIAGRITLMDMLFIAASILAAVAGQLVLKHGMTQLGSQSLTLSPTGVFDLVWRVGTSPWVLLGIGFYVTGMFFWLMVLSRVDLSFAYPMLSISYVIVLGSSWLLLGESISVLRIVGVLAIMGGVAIVSQS